MTELAYCGTDCSQCGYREKMKCPTCKPAAGKMFWGSCTVAACCMEKQLENCGKCDDFPCAMLNEFAYDPEQGDNGKRIENLRSQQ